MGSADMAEFILVTGASSGIGEGIARRLGKSRRLILQGRDAGRLDSVRNGFPNPAEHLLWSAELERGAEAAESLRVLLETAGGVVTSFIHAAGAFRILAITRADYVAASRIFAVNFFSATALLRLLLKRSANHDSLRSVVFISSIASRYGAKGYSLYAATKGALDSLTRSLAAELAPKVRVNSILPGGLRTMGTNFLYESQSEEVINKGYLLGPGSPDDIARMAEFLIGDGSRWITGQQFVIDGGKTAH
jgi:NAD(P)-dependent dehydrogenase (short-subunit alcohol dehydrogenase family)